MASIVALDTAVVKTTCTPQRIKSHQAREQAVLRCSAHTLACRLQNQRGLISIAATVFAATMTTNHLKKGEEPTSESRNILPQNRGIALN
jgi:hypothetical protein